MRSTVVVVVVVQVCSSVLSEQSSVFHQHAFGHVSLHLLPVKIAGMGVERIRNAHLWSLYEVDHRATGLEVGLGHLNKLLVEPPTAGGKSRQDQLAMEIFVFFDAIACPHPRGDTHQFCKRKKRWPLASLRAPISTMACRPTLVPPGRPACRWTYSSLKSG